MVARPRTRRRAARGAPGRVLLLGAGTGEATCGILYVASYLRRHGVEAFVHLTAEEDDERSLARLLEGLLSHVQPAVVGISLKWFHHLARALKVARAVRRFAPAARVVLGGNSATFWASELLRFDCVDDVVLGDGEAPFLALCRGDEAPPNVMSRGAGARPPLSYVQGSSSADVHYSHFDELFLSGLDRASFSGWVAPGKGCGENCLYCSGTRGLQKATFGRAKPFLRPVESVRKDHQEICAWTWQLRYDFAGSTREFLTACWEGVDLSRHATTYFLWGVPPPGLAETLASRFGRVHLVVDVGCFSERQRLEQLQRGLLKPCPTDRELLRVIEAARQYPNLDLEISGIAGLPFASAATLQQERRLVEQVLSLGCTVGSQRLESQPGALVTEHPERFGMVSEARTFDEFLAFFEARPPGDVRVPMVRYADAAFDAQVQATADEVDALVWRAASARRRVTLAPRTRLVDVSVRSRSTLGAWLGAWRVPARLRGARVEVARGLDGAGLACAPDVGPGALDEPAVQTGDEAAALLAVLDAFARATPLDEGVAVARKTCGLRAAEAREVVQHLVAGRFLGASALVDAVPK